jgi:hypothetical protein
MLKYDHKRGMSKCLFLDNEFTCDDCDMRKAGVCEEAFYKKYGRFKDGINR